MLILFYQNWKIILINYIGLEIYPTRVYNKIDKLERKYMMDNCCRTKNTPRDEELNKNLISRLNRIEGQIKGIKKMLEDNRYCGDILIQVSAVEKGLENFGYIILQNHMDTCMTEEIKAGNTEITKEAIELIKYLK